MDKKRQLTNEEVNNMLSLVADNKDNPYLTRSKLRDRAIIMLFAYTGLTVSELYNLDVDDFCLENATLMVKRKKVVQTIPLNHDVCNALIDYIDEERRKIDIETALFLSSRTSNPGRLSISAIERLIKKHGKSLSFDGISPHTLRRTYAKTILEDTNDVKLTAAALGHRNTRTVTRYYKKEG